MAKVPAHERIECAILPIWSAPGHSAPASSGMQNRSIWCATIGADRDRKTAHSDVGADGDRFQGRPEYRGWARTVGMIGGFEQMGEPLAHRVGEDIVVDIPLHFEAAEAIALIRFDRDGKVAGLLLRPASQEPHCGPWMNRGGCT